MYNSIDILEIDSMFFKDNLIDIREKYEYVLGHIDKSVNIPFNYLYINHKDYLDINKKYYIYCSSGNKSRKLSSYLNSIGYNIVDLAGGYNKYINR